MFSKSWLRIVSELVAVCMYSVILHITLLVSGSGELR